MTVATWNGPYDPIGDLRRLQELAKNDRKYPVADNWTAGMKAEMERLLELGLRRHKLMIRASRRRQRKKMKGWL